MPAPKRYWPGRCEFPLTEEYERGHAATFGEKAERYCEGCGRLRVWCECVPPATPFPVIANPCVPQDAVAFVDDDGRLLGCITNIGEAP